MDRQDRKQANSRSSGCSEGEFPPLNGDCNMCLQSTLLLVPSSFLLFLCFITVLCCTKLIILCRHFLSSEVTSAEWEFIKMSEQEEDLIYRMHKLIGDRWALIAGRIPGRKAEEIERFWIMRHDEVFASRRKDMEKSNP